MLFTTKWLSAVFGGHQGQTKDSITINEVTTDSRLKSNKSLFIPLVGENFDGHHYLKQAYDNGAIATLWNKQKDLPSFLPANFPVFYVENTLDALQKLASAYRQEINPTVVGITGSNGKTTTKDIVASVLKKAYKTHYTKGNFNNHIGLPLTILSMERHTEILVLEMGMNHKGEIEKLTKIANPDYAIITNIGESHIEFLGSRKAIANAKLEIVQGMGEKSSLIIDGDEELLASIKPKTNVITCGFHHSNNVVINDTEIFHQETRFHLSDGEWWTIPLLGKHNALNATYAITLGKLLGMNETVISEALQTLERTSMRFEMLEGNNGVSIINDAYNASPTSMKAAIEVMKQIEGFKEKVLILGDILELGDYSKEMHESVAKVITYPVTALFTFGKESKYISDQIQKENQRMTCMHFDSKEKLFVKLRGYLRKDALLLFKASRGMQLESLVEAIQKKSF
ncbi:UDP-N-acetylmuramoyl-tripeptide--D-alanyl-D-alanine ligase [Virgibacillus alimentarius]|uniref:UDP-N-acetylmuramoyl-tripeptide--D-alanyl-D-alanine ligase n=1 Tax=Virgibacillus alimentarius TaxID=698769 RepID=A0ABS4S4Z2_9BACI|nr:MULTISPECIES: UDP-N-acetylmuramoyl-tripeptide--D-alanyl-D-alanine ligase [Virgibacillus]MBP2256111.1 UDP-N-acetylmuramoyl-tripeptide--D-alanyl-D-alanine ligase [Virgibacillus alimentarius]HLR66058.1 UDP-N-acetylmuramoyl-tripeptide--D-alanyl-D-alanine ligase [Virgibacillus sp.]